MREERESLLQLPDFAVSARSGTSSPAAACEYSVACGGRFGWSLGHGPPRVSINMATRSNSRSEWITGDRSRSESIPPLEKGLRAEDGLG